MARTHVIESGTDMPNGNPSIWVKVTQTEEDYDLGEPKFYAAAIARKYARENGRGRASKITSGCSFDSKTRVGEYRYLYSLAKAGE